jgi:hypothetical protein
MFLIPTNCNLRLENFLDVNDKDKQIAKFTECEAKVKWNLMKRLYEVDRLKYLENLRRYYGRLKGFADSNKEAINVMRSKFMLLVGPDKLRMLHAYEENLLREVKKNGGQDNDRDYLPFGNKTLFFAEKLKHAPKKPIFKAKIDAARFADLFVEYFKTLKND